VVPQLFPQNLHPAVSQQKTEIVVVRLQYWCVNANFELSLFKGDIVKPSGRSWQSSLYKDSLDLFDELRIYHSRKGEAEEGERSMPVSQREMTICTARW
jgi:hypothetical protein